MRSLFDETSRPSGAVVALLNPDWTDPELPDRPDVGSLVIFDASGRIVPVFEAANYLSESDGVVRYGADGAVAVVHQFGYAGDPDWSVEALHVVPATVTQASILSVLIGAPEGRFRDPAHPKWKWQAQNQDAQGNLKFEIGPGRPDGSIDTKAVYSYSPKTHRYEGPAGSLAGDFYLLPPLPSGCTWAAAEEFVQAHGIHSTPGAKCCPCGERR